MSGTGALSCPLCGGAVAPPRTSRRLECGYCGRPLLYTGPSFTPRLALSPRLDQGALQRVCSGLFHHPLLPKGLAQGAVLVKKRRMYVPFYLLTGTRGGILEIGKERVQRTGGLHADLAFAEDGTLESRWANGPKTTVTVEEDSRVILGEFRYAYSAAGLDELGLFEAVLKEMVLAHGEAARPVALGALARDADVVDPDLPLERIVEKGVGAALGARGELEILEMRATIVYAPVITLSFRWGHLRFSVTVEELEGHLLAGELPFRKTWAYGLAVPIVAGMGLVLGNALALAIKAASHGGVASLGLAQVAGTLGVLLFAGLAIGLQVAWGVLRLPLVVRVTPGGPRVERAGELPRNPFAPVNALLRWCVDAAMRPKRQGWETE